MYCTIAVPAVFYIVSNHRTASTIIQKEVEVLARTVDWSVRSQTPETPPPIANPDDPVNNKQNNKTTYRLPLSRQGEENLQKYIQLQGESRPRRHLRFEDFIWPAVPVKDPPMKTAYQQSTVILQAPWFPHRKLCKETCCAEPRAISIGQDAKRLKNSIDGHDLADLQLFGHNLQYFHDFAARELTHDVVPCLRPGVIIHADSYRGPITRWFEEYRPNVTVPYVLVTSKTDGHMPIEFFEHKLDEDALMLKWYGNNPSYLTGANHSKFQMMPLGLAGARFRQQPDFDLLMEARGFANPFGGDKSRWINSTILATANDTTHLLFVNFGFHVNALHRKAPYEMACKGRTAPRLDNVSCNKNKTTAPRETYKAASKYMFGLSPPGNGKDCFRTYELLFNGIIPIVKYQKEYDALFRDLPIMYLRTWNLSQAKLLQKMRDFIHSPEFINNDFEKGWERMFLSYWRHKILSDAGRLNETVFDDNGNQYYTMWSYTTHRKPHVQHAVSKELARRQPPGGKGIPQH